MDTRPDFYHFFLLSFILTNMDTRPDFYHFFLLSFILNIMDTRRQIYYYFYQARALRALGLLLADGTPTVGGGKTFWAVSKIFLRKQL